MQSGRTVTITSSDNPCAMKKSMESIDRTEAFRRVLTYGKSMVYKAVVAFCLAFLAELGNHGRRMPTAVVFFSMSK